LGASGLFERRVVRGSMFISEAFAASGAAADPTSGFLIQMAPLILVVIVFYFFLIRPQTQARKRHAEMVAALKKNDIVVTSSGFIGKIKSVQDDEVRLELAPNVDVRIVRGAIAELRSKTDPAPANDSKPSE
jgi:preprotein translocase subunit YajC